MLLGKERQKRVATMSRAVVGARRGEKKDAPARPREFVERTKKLARQIEELRDEGNDNWAKQLVRR
jgi:hypothetical protein